MCTAISNEADISFHIFLSGWEFQVKISQELERFVFVLFVPENTIIIFYLVCAVDLMVNRFTSSLNDEWRCLEDIGGMRDTCGNRTDNFIKSEIISSSYV